MMDKKGQVEIIIGIILLFFFISTLIPAITQSINAASCKNEKATIDDLQNKLNQCQNLLIGEQQKTQNTITNLEECKKELDECRNQNANCNKLYKELQDECQKKEQPTHIYYFIKVFSDKIILFDAIIIYNIQLFGLSLAFGMTFTIKLFEIDVEIKVLNKQNQKKLVRIIRRYLIEHPYMPILFMLAIIFITNIL